MWSWTADKEKAFDYEVAYCTDTGIQKNVNQDSACYVIADTPYGPVCMVCVCDGMGGISMGEYASSEAVRVCIEWFETKLPERLEKEQGLEKLATEWVEMLQELDIRFREFGKERGLKLGTTVTVMLFWKEKYLLVQSGDSRAYEMGKNIVQLSEDQSYIQQQINLGALTPEEARHHPRRNILLHCIGGSRPSTPEYRIGRISKKVNYVLCSDGFVHEISDEEMLEYLAYRNKSEIEWFHGNLSKLIGMAKRRGENDNITALLVKVERCNVSRNQKTEFFFHIRQKKILAEGEMPAFTEVVTTDAGE